MSKKVLSSCIIMLFAVAAVATAAHYVYNCGFRTEVTAYVYIDSDDNVDSVASKIEEAGEPECMGVFHLYARLLNLEERLHTGRYKLNKDLSMLNLVLNIRSHNETPVSLVVPSVRTLDEMAGRIARQLMVDSASIADCLANDELITSLGFTAESLPSMFVPNTYEVYWDVKTIDLARRMKKEHDAFWNEERLAKLESVSLYAGEEMTREKVATLASIVDSETANNGEKPTIAALYMNRMRKGMRLQSDPTVIFALKDFSIRRVLEQHLAFDSPYNTYRYAGLPPGPIRVPSIAGIDAVLNFQGNNYIYMCAKEDFSGTHNFAVSYGEHLRNAAKYIRELNKRGIR